MRELQTLQTTEFIQQYRTNWKEHVDRMISNRIPGEKDLNIQPKVKKVWGNL
jgi:hypothetical protein